uniref:Retrovirus-related Pol polyprotein from transposon TNT 1-94 n=1 Tax=Tanacetum cinerariifolium TaxID=118510 RepID=A0A6L2NUX0_TANCI|nr:retrovirus-related Pol polyprotein from transposon TNT 1-94 [Tanacetum cinerariifolium]
MKYFESFATKKIQADFDLKATNIILQGLPSDIYSLVNHHRVAKDLWEKVQLLMQGTSLTKQEREHKLYDALDKFTHIKGESLHQYYLRFTQLINDMNIYKMKMEQFHVNTKFLNSLLPKWRETKFLCCWHFRTRANTSRIEGNYSGQQRVVKCFNCQREGHMARQCPKPKRKRDATWFREKVLLVEAQGNGKVLNEEELEFLVDPSIKKGPVTQSVITHNATYQANYLDAYDSDCDEISTAKAVLMANLSSFGSDVLSKIRPMLYDDNVIAKEANVISIADFRETMILEEERKSVCHNSIKNDIRKVKGKDIVANAAQMLNDATIALGMYKLGPVILAPKVSDNREAHEYYLKHTMKQAAILNEVVEQAKSRNPLDNASYSACMYAKLIQELLGYVRDTCPYIHKHGEKLVTGMPINKKKTIRFVETVTSSEKIPKVTNRPILFSTGVNPTTSASGSKSSGNTKSDRISQTPSSAKSLCFGCNECLFDANHAMCLIVHVNSMNVRAKSASMKNKKRKEWKPTGTNLYSLSIGDMMASSPICLLSKATKTKSWLWHHRLSHLNLDAINHLAIHGLVRGLPRLTFEKDHLCYACAMGKSKKQSHKPKSKDTNQERLYLLHMDLCGPMRVASINGKKYILIIVDNYSRFTWVKFLALKDEVPDFIIKFLKMIQVRLNATVKNIRTDNGTEFVNQTLHVYYEHVGISHETSVVRTLQQNGHELQCMTPATPSSRLVPNLPPSAPFVPPSRHEWDLVFQPVFDEFFPPPASIASPVLVEEPSALIESTESPS